MEYTVVNFLVENLLHLLSKNIDLIKGVDDEFKNLLEEVQRLKAFLDDAAKLHSDNNSWDLLTKEIKKILHKAEDVIDKFLGQAMLRPDKNKVGRFFAVGHLTTVRNLAGEIKEIHEMVKKLREDNKDSFRPKPILDIPKKEHRQVTQGSALGDDVVVGLDEEAKILIKKLLQGSAESLDIIPVVGVQGLGKTTLLRKTYNHRMVSFEFACSIWVYVGQEYKMKDIFLTILKFFTKRIEEYLSEDEDTLAEVIRCFMDKGDRCLIVLDDVREARVVDHVRKVFPENEKGHRIILTTRDGRLAAYTNPYPHNLRFLTPEESFELLVKRVVGKGTCPNEFKLGKKIPKNNGGVPLAIEVIAGALRGRSTTNDWELIERNMVKHSFNNPESFLKFVEINYDSLP